MRALVQAPGRWRRRGLAFLLGAIGALALAPFNLFPVLFVSFTGLFWLLDDARRAREGFGTGWWFGWGHFICGLFWIASAFLVEPDKFAWMIPFPVLGLPALLALFTGAACALAVAVSRPGPMRLAALAAAWTLAEFARGHVLTGFPWNLAGHAMAFSDATMQPAAWIGVTGLSLVVIAATAAPGLFAGYGRPGRRAGGLALVLLAVLSLAGWMRLSPVGAAPGDGPVVRVVQPNIAQRDKWDRDRLVENFELQLAMSRDPEADVVIWSETAVVWSIEDTQPVRDALAAVAAGLSGGRGGVLVTGVPRFVRDDDPPTWRNSARAIGPDGSFLATYDKVHLVPFGEYLPLRPLLQQIGLERLAQGRGDFQRGPDVQVFDVPGLPPAGVMICYEAIFPGRAVPGRRPAWLINLTNDGWFGELTGPYQHFVSARFRSVEQGLPLVRAAGTGVSAIVDPFGRIVASQALGTRGAITAVLPKPLQPTIYNTVGDIAAMMIAIFVLLAAAIRRLFW
ncbi:MAG: apolipoprotein N-acyltransferase [Pseudomonadota bacterium]|nr:apolipoprotein N-acyltransferase [Pseudomonadota bacterium]